MREPFRIQKYKLTDNKDKFYNYYSDKRGLIMIRRKGFTTFFNLAFELRKTGRFTSELKYFLVFLAVPWDSLLSYTPLRRHFNSMSQSQVPLL